MDRYTFQSLGDYDWRAALRSVTAPLLVIHGALDVIPVPAAREWVANLPNSRILVMPGFGHFVYMEAPDRFFTAVDAFLKGGWPEGAETASVS